MFQSRLKEAADAAIKDKDASCIQTAAAAGEFFDSSDVRNSDASAENSTEKGLLDDDEDLEEEKPDMRSVLGFLNQNEWIYNLNIGNIMQI